MTTVNKCNKQTVTFQHSLCCFSKIITDGVEQRTMKAWNVLSGFTDFQICSSIFNLKVQTRISESLVQSVLVQFKCELYLIEISEKELAAYLLKRIKTCNFYLPCMN